MKNLWRFLKKKTNTRKYKECQWKTRRKNRKYETELPTLFFKLIELVGTFFNLSISNFSLLDFKLAKPTFLANFDVSTPVAVLKSAFVG